MRVALIGAGLMGGPMGGNLLAADHELRVWNRTRERAQALAGATVCATPAEACAGAEVIVTMLADAAAVEQAMDGVATGGAVWAQMSTIGVEATERLARGEFVDAPVLGSTPAAEQGALTILASGPFARCRPVFDALGTTIDCGPEAGARRGRRRDRAAGRAAGRRSAAVPGHHRRWCDGPALCQAQGHEDDRAHV
jgi:3-hydroxyisobutyrate dehydrogenase